MSRYEDDMWDKLSAQHGDELSRLKVPAPPPRRGPQPRWAIAGGTALIAAIAAVVVVLVSASTAPPAWAVNRRPDGSVLVTLRNPAGIAALNAQLRSMGVNARVVAAAGSCAGRTKVMTLRPVTAHPQVAPSRLSVPVQQTVIRPGKVAAGNARVIIATQRAGKLALVQALATGVPPTCVAQVKQQAGRIRLIASVMAMSAARRAGGPVTCHPVGAKLAPAVLARALAAARRARGADAQIHTATAQTGTAQTRTVAVPTTTVAAATGTGTAQASVTAPPPGATVHPAVVCSRPVPGPGTATNWTTQTATSTSAGTGTSTNH